MKFVSIKRSLFLCLFFVSGFAFAQDPIDSETVTVVKPYSPSVREASKIKAVPGKADSVSTTKKSVKYNIFSVPVASTFTPVKGRATRVERERAPKAYDNYASLGLGNYTNVLAEFYSNIEVNRDQNFGVYLLHNSSQGGIDGVLLDNKFYNTSLNLNYGSKDRDYSWNTELGVQHQLYNWYGVSEELPLTDTEILSIDPQQNYYSVFGGGNIEFYDSFFKRADLEIRQTGDASGTSEQKIDLNSTLEFNIADELITTDIQANFLNGSTDRFYAADIENKYSFLNVGINPSLLILRNDLTLNIGAAFFYSSDIENSDGNFYLYPKVTASYKLVEDYFTPYAGLEGGLKQNSYYDFVQQNPYVSPTSMVAPTDNLYNFYLGAKGKLTNTISYNFRGGYNAEDVKPLFVKNAYDPSIGEGYAYGNSFGVVYDNVKTLSFYANVSVDVSDDFRLGITGEFFDYDTDIQDEAWNLPTYNAELTADYQITDKWYAGANLFLVGQREAMGIVDNRPVDGGIDREPITLDSYFDANAHVGYRINDQFTAFVKGSNLLNNDYQQWSDFQVQGIQVLGGVTYKFDYN
ncbi:TonB-dependent receptor [Zunongwangia sp. HRR-M8]|uniref:TonB-dependent receptor n=1 Tax=Zunongwangia sp. HRR-M8 TaxID=3015170 RepID=UPI0022DE565D|nr:TonB-dependent receptor [Zunongwangia sp. HRR-M8]WBL21615.1 TonB-dependent receptor [Zunongwangia sp. HRR-M8]